MRGGALPAAIAIAALALMLGFVTRKTAASALLLAFVVALAASGVAVSDDWTEAAFLGCWVSSVAAGSLVYLPRPPGAAVALTMAAVVGLPAGLVVAVDGVSSDLLVVSFAALLVVPASVAVERGYRMVPRVIVGWLLAVSLLAAVLPFVVTHPGYVPDHRG